MAVARVHVRSWQAAYRGLLPDDYLDQLRPEDRAPKYTFGNPDPLTPWTVVAGEKGSVYGFATTGPARDRDLTECGELMALYVDPERWGRGIGNALMSAARARLDELGFRNAILWVLEAGVGRDGRRGPLPAAARLVADINRYTGWSNCNPKAFHIGDSRSWLPVGSVWRLPFSRSGWAIACQEFRAPPMAKWIWPHRPPGRWTGNRISRESGKARRNTSTIWPTI